MDQVNCPVCGAYIKVPVNTDGTYRDFYCPVCDELLRSRVERRVTLEQRHLSEASTRPDDACYICEETEGYHEKWCSRGNKSRG